MNNLEIFVKRLKRIGIEVTFIGNFPWVYLDTVNGKKVKGTYQGNHGFTAFWSTHKLFMITDIDIVFDKIRETLGS